MNYVLLSMVPALLFACTNHIDKYLIEKYLRGRTVGSLVLFSSLAGLPVFIVIWLLTPGVLSVAPTSAAFLVLNGAIYICSVIPFFYALAEDEASVVEPLFLMAPIFGAVFGYLFLDETLTFSQMVGAMFIMLGVLGLCLERGERVRVKKKIFWLMLLTSLLTAVNALLFKIVAVQESFWRSAFWEYVGFFAFAVLIFIFHQSYRRQFLSVVKTNKLSVMGINLFNEFLAVSAKTILHFATLLAPLSLVLWVAEGFQPFFVLLLGIIITIFFPSIGQERLHKSVLLQKISSMALMCAGLYLM